MCIFADVLFIKSQITPPLRSLLMIQFVAGSQPLNAIAFVLDGLYYGVSDFGFAAYSMVKLQKLLHGMVPPLMVLAILIGPILMTRCSSH